MNTIITPLAVLIALVALSTFLSKNSKRRHSKEKISKLQSPDIPEELPYRLRDDFLSGAEFDFYKYLRKSSESVGVVCPKVSLQDIFFVSQGDRKTKFGLWQKINKKHVDFLLCDPTTMKPIIGVELDDRSHQRPERQERDEFVNNLFETAELPLLRFQVKKEYSESRIKKAINDAIQAVTPPQCPKCNIPFNLKVNYKDQLFWGCENYPKCKCSENYDEEKNECPKQRSNSAA